MCQVERSSKDVQLLLQLWDGQGHWRHEQSLRIAAGMGMCDVCVAGLVLLVW